MAASSVRAIQSALRAHADAERAAGSLRFFKTGPGEYGEGDRFLGLTVPQIRSVVRAHRATQVDDALALLDSPWHEERLCAVLLLVEAHARGDEDARRAVLDAYLARAATHVNNWDLVDASAAQIVGPHVAPNDLALLDRLAASTSVWERRIAMIATFHHIRRGDLGPALHVAERLLGDRHDLIHKAVGWMLREAAKRDRGAVESFLGRHLARMPRTTLRYAIERFSSDDRRRWMAR
jgi:3-methyladenine DNA glycosylase AlkD